MNHNDINRATAKAYIHDYITNGIDNTTDDWDMDEAADKLLENVYKNNLDSYDDVDPDDFTAILEASQID